MNKFGETSEAERRNEIPQNNLEVVKQQEKTAKEMSEMILERSGNEVADFQAENEIELARNRQRAEKEGLIEDAQDIEALQKLSAEAAASRDYLVAEIEKNDIENDEATGLFLKKAEFFLSVIDKGTSPEQADVCLDFFESYLKEPDSLAEFVKNKETSGVALKVIREALFLESEVEKYNGKIKIEGIETHKNIFDLLNVSIADSLDEIGQYMESQDSSESDKQHDNERTQYVSNAFFAVSNVLGSSMAVNRSKANQFLFEHMKDLDGLGVINEGGGTIDYVSESTFFNIIEKSENSEVLRKSIEVALNEFPDFALNLKALLCKEYPGHLQNRRAEIAEIYADRFGFDPGIVEKWKKTKIPLGKDADKKDTYIENFGQNMESAIRLEKARTGIVNLLFKEFGIANFARYDDNVLIHQIDSKDEDVPYGVVIFPETDWNGAFFSDRNNLKNMNKDLTTGGYEMRIIEVASQFDMAKRLSGFDKKYSKGGNKIDFVVLGGHGSKFSIDLGETTIDAIDDDPPPIKIDEMSDEDYEKILREWESKNDVKMTDKSRRTMILDDIENGDAKGMRRAVDKWLSEEAPIVFFSCSTGAEGGIAQAASKNFGIHAVAPELPASEMPVSVSFDAKNKPIFSVEYKNKGENVKTGNYLSGKRI